MSCQYLAKDLGNQPLLSELAAEHAVRSGNVELLKDCRARGLEVTAALEYSVKLGKHSVTERLLQIGTPVTLKALENAALRRGPGMDMLFASLRPEDKPRAMSAGMSFRLSAGEFEKAYGMLGNGVAPDRHFISAALHTLQWQPSFHETFHEALDAVLTHALPEVLAEMDLHLLVEHGRSIHIERVMELTNRSSSELLSNVLGSYQGNCVARLREMGAKVDSEAIFGFCVKSIRQNSKEEIGLYIDRLCGLAIEDGCAEKIGIIHTAQLFTALLDRDSVLFYSGSYGNSRSWERLRGSLNKLLVCTKAEQRCQLHQVIDDWQRQQIRETALTARGLQEIHALVDELSIEQVHTGISP